MENHEINEVTTQETEQKAVETIKITFSRKLAKPFTSKGGKEMVAISIPNQDAEDKRPWEEFVLPIQMLHSDHYGSKTLWAKIPEDGSTTLTRSISLPKTAVLGQGRKGPLTTRLLSRWSKPTNSSLKLRVHGN